MSPNKDLPNSHDFKIPISFKDLLKWRRARSRKKKDFSYIIPQANNKELDFIKTNRKEFSLTWIGHATFLIQICGLNIVTDPVWAKRMGFQKRLAPPGISISDLPEIDIVLISHNHYDHLDFTSLRQLKGKPLHLVPKGLGKLFNKKGLKSTEEFMWWNHKTINNKIEVTFVPAQHWSRRTPWDTNKSFWGGWVIKENDKFLADKKQGVTIYFVGDSGYFDGFKQIGERFNPNYILAPIGCYEPEWFMSYQHMTPEQAIQAYLDSNSNILIPMHYDAFQLADDTPKEALDRLEAELKRRKSDAINLKILKLGETLRNN